MRQKGFETFLVAASIFAEMFKKFYKIFYYEVFFYVIDAPKATVVERIDQLFTERRCLFESPNLSGKFVTYPETFYMEQKWWLANIRSIENEPAILKGVITEINKRRTKIEIAIRPNSIFLIFCIFFLPYGIYHLYIAIVTKELNSLYLGIWTFLFVLPFLFVTARFCSKRLRKNFEKYMNISPIHEGDFPKTSESV